MVIRQYHCRRQEASNSNINKEEEKAFIAVDVDKMSYQEKEKMVTKLHNQFGHPLYDKLSKFLTNADMKDGQFFNILQEFSAKCDVCLEYRRKNPRPVVGLSLAKEFNDVIAMDLKPLNNVHIPHLIDLSTRYSNAVVVIDPNIKMSLLRIFFNIGLPFLEH